MQHELCTRVLLACHVTRLVQGCYKVVMYTLYLSLLVQRGYNVVICTMYKGVICTSYLPLCLILEVELIATFEDCPYLNLCYKGDTRVVQQCYKSVTRVLQVTLGSPGLSLYSCVYFVSLYDVLYCEVTTSVCCCFVCGVPMRFIVIF
jgi:hypothetical protein